MTLQEIIEKNLDRKTREYSGRGMYGKSCLGVEVDNVLSFVYELGQVVANYDYVERELQWSSRIHSDSMGLDYIVYFPTEPYIKEAEKNVDEDE